MEEPIAPSNEMPQPPKQVQLPQCPPNLPEQHKEAYRNFCQMKIDAYNRELEIYKQKIKEHQQYQEEYEKKLQAYNRNKEIKA